MRLIRLAVILVMLSTGPAIADPYVLKCTDGKYPLADITIDIEKRK
jgi:hypothetical protein